MSVNSALNAIVIKNASRQPPFLKSIFLTGGQCETLKGRTASVSSCHRDPTCSTHSDHGRSQNDEKEGQTATFLVATGVSKSARTEVFTDYNFKPNKQENVKKSQTT